MKTSWLLGIVPESSRAESAFAGHVLTYTPEGSNFSDSKVPLIGFSEPSLRDAGGATDARTWLARNAETWSPTRPGWFERVLREANCGWFVPILHRLAAGENVPAEEIKKLYSDHNDGKPIIEGTGEAFIAKIREVQSQLK